MLLRLVALALLFICSAGMFCAAADLVPNPTFATDADGDGSPDGWKLPNGASWGSDRHLSLVSGGPATSPSLYRKIDVKGAKALHLHLRVRVTDVRRGSEAWNDARVMIDLLDADGKKVKGGPGHPYFTGTTGWVEKDLRFRVPEGVAAIALMPGIFNASGGTFDIGEISLRAIPEDEVPSPTIDDSQPLVIDAGGAQPPMLTVSGNKVLTADGKEVWLQGLCVPSLEWSNTGERILQAVIAGIEDWKANVIRLPVSGKRWFGQEKGQDDDGAAYRALVDQCVLACSSRSVHLILDLHHYRAPKDLDVAFWKDAAIRYKDNPAVLFGLLNEPHNISWEVWRNGGEVTDKKRVTDAANENAEVLTTFTTVGMQGLIDAVRDTGAKNIVLVGGLDWAYDLSGVLKGFGCSDPTGNGIIYDTHVYPWKSKWQESFLDVAAIHPVLLGEVGCDIARMSFIPPERHEDPYTWAPDMLACIQKHRLHWTAWSFHPGATPRILASNKDFAPTPWWGAFVRAALRGATWQSDKLR